jgi:aspartyl-tRNA(Asn)/glutamyl-tRNA(Gln) amidotransferase subunit A
MARSARDCALVLDAIAGHDPNDPSSLPAPAEWSNDRGRRLRVAVLRDAAVHVQPEIGANMRDSLDVLREFADVAEVALPDYPYGVVGEQIITAEAASAFEELFASGRVGSLTAPEDRHGLADGLTMPAIDYLRAMRIRRLAARDVERVLTGVDAIVAPTTQTVANPITARFSDYFPDDHGPSLGGVGNICGLPAISIPNGFGERRLPTGLEIAGRAWDDKAVLAVAAAYQARTDWHRRRPPAL